MITQTDRERILNKIKKCLALSKSSNEHEAAAALRQAQKLMELHNIDLESVDQADFVSCVVLSDYEWGRKKPVILMSVVMLIKKAIGVEPVFEHGRRDFGDGRMGTEVHAVRYFGPRARVFMAEHAHTVVYRAVGKAWREHLEVNPFVKGQIGARAGFFVGWCETVESKVSALVMSPEEVKRTELAKATHYGRELGRAKTGGGFRDSTRMMGAMAGKDFDINRPVGQDKMRLEKL